jgi:exopolyphosphatase / guanosine-5'-triphosphate,3'-diphosphate pyrophosphatase
VPYACIDVGSNTTRLLVADVRGGRLEELAAERVFTRIGRCLAEGGRIGPEKIAEGAEVVAVQWRRARELESRDVAVVATAVIRDAVNGRELIEAIAERTGLAVEVLSEREEARLAFLGATRTLDEPPAGRVAVVDVGGGSSEVAVGTVDGEMESYASFRIGSGSLADAHLRGDPPTSAEIENLRREVVNAIAGVEVPPNESAVAVGGSASSLRRLVGAELSAEALGRAIDLLRSHPREEIARRFELDTERVRLLPAGVIVLDELRRRASPPLVAGRGGIREGAILELALGHRAGQLPEAAADAD